jgi:5,5'-dehydrodivanillate O-demethylase
MLTRKENERFTRFGPGTPCGEMMRRYWWPVGFADELKGARPRKVKLLGEEFVLFRDGAGSIGMLDILCAHRRTSLALGRVEEKGLRCCYHGWLFDSTGRCLDQPCEEPDSNFKDKVRQRAYPTQVAAGIVFAYIGPKPVPLLPKYDLLQCNFGKRVLWSNLNHCNWLQTVENAADVSHIPWLHAGPYPGFAAKRPRITWTRNRWGLHWEIAIDGYNDVNAGDVIFPNGNRFASSRIGQAWSQLQDRDMDARQNLLYRVPEDDVTTRNYFLALYNESDTLVQITQPERVVRVGEYAHVEDGWWDIDSRDQDRAAAEGQGPITDRTLEKLAPSDRGVTMFRQMLREAIDAVAAGKDPTGVIRNLNEDKTIYFGTHQHDVVPPVPETAGAAE